MRGFFRTIQVDRRARRSRLDAMRRAALEALEPRLLMSALTAGEIAATWNEAGLGAAGTIAFDDAGTITGGSLASGDGSGTPSGTYSITPSGGLTVVTPQFQITGVVAAGGGVAVTTSLIPATGSFSDSLSVLVKTSSSGFSDADASGLWWLFLDGDDSGSTGQGSVVFDGSGHISSGSVVAADGTTTFTGGNYTVSSTGAITAVVDLHTADGQDKSATLSGQIDPDKQTAAMSPADFVDAAGGDGSLLFVAMKSSGGFSAADLSGAWNFDGDGFGGSVLLDGHGKVTSGAGIGTGGDALAVTGTYSVAPDGFVTLSLRVVSSEGTSTLAFHGWLNASKDLAAVEPTPSSDPGSDTADKLLLLTRTGDNAPTLSSVGSFGTATGGSAFAGITGTALLDQSDAGDADGDSVSLFITSLGTGTLSLNGSPTHGGEMISSGDTLSWTPPATASGAVTAFSVKAFDGAVYSATAVPVVVNTVLPATVSITANKNKASEINDGVSKGIGQFTVTRAHGDLSQPLTVFYSDTAGTAAEGTDFQALPGSITLGPHVTSATITLIPQPAAEAAPTQTAIVTIAPDADYAVTAKKGSGTVTITDVQWAPATLSGLNLTASVATGSGDFGTGSSYQILLNPADDTYLRIGGGGDFVSNGTYSYHRFTSTGAAITMDDSSLGEIDGTLTFSSAKAAAFDFGINGQMAQQTGKIAVGTPKASALAPASLAGRSANVTLTAGQALGARGNLQLALAQGSDEFVVAGAPALGSSFGTYTYEQFSRAVGVLTVQDSSNGNGLIVMQFTSATAATYASGYMSGAWQQGRFTLNSIPRSTWIPTNFSDQSFTGTISAGAAPFPARGTFSQTFSASTYGIGGAAVSTGNYTEQALTPTIALLTLTDIAGGPEHEVVTYASPTRASVLLFNDTAGGYAIVGVIVAVPGGAG